MPFLFINKENWCDMKPVLIILILGMVGCSTLSNPDGAIQPVVYKNMKEKTYATTCSGAVEEWGSCFYKAKQTCGSGYTIISRNEGVIGGKRELVFKCNP